MIEPHSIQIGQDGPQDPTLRSMVLSVVLMEGGQAKVTAVTDGLADPEEEGWDQQVRAALLELTEAGVLTADGDAVTLTLGADGWRDLAVATADALAEVADTTGYGATTVIAQVVEQTNIVP